MRVGLLVLLTGWLSLLFLCGLGDRDLWNSHEARAGMDAVSLLDGNGLLPRLFDDRPELQKPPLYYWLVATVARLRGGTVDAWAVRLPAALAAILCVGIVALFGWRCGRPREGLLAAMMLATAVHFTWLGRVGRIDMPLTCVVAATLVCFSLAERTGASQCRRLGLLLAAYLCLAAAVLLKGPIGIVLPVAAFGTHLLGEGEVPPPWRLRRWGGLVHRLGLWWGLPLLGALTVPWFWVADRATDGEWTRVFLWHHNVERGLGGSSLRGHPWWFYGPHFAVDFLPWSLLIPLAGRYFLGRGRWRADREARFGLAWFLAMAIVLSCARYKRADYLVPAYPGAALFLGCSLCRWYREAMTRERSLLLRAAPLALAVVLIGAGVGWWARVTFFLPSLEPTREHHTFAARVREQAPRPEPVILFQTESHALAFHLGRPLRSLRFWEELDRVTLSRDTGADTPHFVIVPAGIARDWPRSLRRIRLEEVADNFRGVNGGHEKPLILFRIVRVRTTEEETASSLRAAPESR
jgi:4-amino-4-deoxy-L-arabinose transferase-like glycosyltransferase